MKRFTRISALLITILLLAACGSRGLQVSDAWARPSLQGNNAAVYLVIQNATSEDETLLSASTELASSVELHMTMQAEGEDGSDEAGVMRMMPQESVSIPAGEIVEFMPGGLHIMLFELKQDLQIGDTFNLTLQFEYNREMVVEVTVEER